MNANCSDELLTEASPPVDSGVVTGLNVVESFCPWLGEASGMGLTMADGQVR